MRNERPPRKAKPRLAGRGITNRAPSDQVASVVYTTGPAGAIFSAPLWPAIMDSAASGLSSLWRWLP